MRSLGLSGHQRAQLPKRLRPFQQPALGRNSQPLFQSRRQLHPAQAVQMQILGQPQFVSDAGRRLAGNLRNQRQQPVRRGPKGVCAGLLLRRQQPRPESPASHAATALRLTLPVEVRGRSGSGHSTQRRSR